MWLTVYQLHTLAPLVREEPLNVNLLDMQVLEATWVSGGTTHTLKTTREAGETDADFLARHRTLLIAAQDPNTGFPPD